MIYLVLGIAVVALAIWAAQSFVKANPADLVRRLRTASGVALLGGALVLVLTGRWALAMPVAIFALSLFGLGGSGSRRGGQPSAGQRSRVRSALLEMELDHDSGEMSGRVLAGRFEGQMLEGLQVEDLKALWGEAVRDAESRALLEAYLDRRLPGWREDFQADGADGQGGPAGTGAMTDEEAYQVLGLAPGAGEAEIRAAHRRLMKRLHPDHGGTAFLAAKLNEAKERLLGRH
ncbi:DnaJ domain-containing protein [Polymorphum gilvum]|uniref:Heat shock protein DnaJ-like protein n=1 Tax=Polymorphum gilvum (strain LMG 25793 / CGMCC 1.9160 / SL003B-26A1) TaxID=991905 RepID=F2IVW7_POLGS|nr:DnaJ domain-containing protein [Polymorphum gilvum]ADZ70249.1 Heat shock protein DnaJ-like protein [Polymorphum gilvum SL003B-26A1]